MADSVHAVAVVGAGAMGAALAAHLGRERRSVMLLGTKFDEKAIDAVVAGDAHPALGVTLPRSVEGVGHQDWDGALAEADMVVLAVSSAGFPDVVEQIALQSRSDVLWAVATKGWDERTLRSPSEVVAAARGSSDRVAVISGPALAPEVVAGAPTALVCAATDPAVAAAVAQAFHSSPVRAIVSDDVAGAETSSAYKNVVAIAVGICDGLGEQLIQQAMVHRFANTRAAIFAIGLQDTLALAQLRGGRAETILGLAGAGDLYVTCLGGRNGSFGRLLGLGETPKQARTTIGSTVEGIANTKCALALAAAGGIDLVTARAVDAMLTHDSSAADAIEELLAAAFGGV